jgi:transcriptional regulator with XRE-family HTH domain
MRIEVQLSDETVLKELGDRLLRLRLDLQYTQAFVAKNAGVAKRTLERIESGASAQTTTLIRILRVLHCFNGLDALLPEVGHRPMDLLLRKGKSAQRASVSTAAEKPWTWGDDK